MRQRIKQVHLLCQPSVLVFVKGGSQGSGQAACGAGGQRLHRPTQIVKEWGVPFRPEFVKELMIFITVSIIQRFCRPTQIVRNGASPSILNSLNNYQSIYSIYNPEASPLHPNCEGRGRPLPF